MLPCADTSKTSPRLARDERGAIALLGLFMAVFLVAVVYYLVGIGNAVLQREQLQDAADAAAFSSAVLHARGMNLIALINMTMAALLAILVALKLVETLTSLALVLITAFSFLNPGLATFVPGLAQLRQQVRSAHDALRPPIYTMLETLHAAARGVRSIVPAAGQLAVLDSVRAQASDLIESGLAVPASASLPTEDGQFPELCERATGYVGALASFALGGNLVPGPVAGAVADATEELADAGASWFCGATDRPPSYRRSDPLEHPKLPARAICEAFADAADYDARRHEELCAEADRQERASQPDRQTGSCATGCNIELYEQRAALARQACAPRAKRDRLEQFEWQERRYLRTYVANRGVWRIASEPQDEEADAGYRLRKTPRRPCGGRNALVAADWNLTLRRTPAGPIEPLCTDAAPPASPPGRGTQRVTLEHVDVVHVFGCTEQVEHTLELGAARLGDRSDGGDGELDDKVPQTLKPGVELGEEAFQIRAAIFARDAPRAPERVIEVASWGRGPSAGARLLALGPSLGRVAFAQAEYFYATQTAARSERANFLWNMRWRARLRRFRLPPAAGGFIELFEPACVSVLGAGSTTEGSPCSALVSSLGLIVH